MRKTFLAILFFTSIVTAQPVEVLQEDGITVSFEKSGDESQVKQFRDNLLPKVKSILESLSSDLGRGPKKEAKVFFYSPETYAKKFPQLVSSRISAFYDGSGVNATADNEMTTALENTLRHELTHLIVGQNYCRQIPTWLNEGLAVYEERKNTIDSTPIFVDYNTIVVAKQQGTMLPIEQLEGASIFHRQQGTTTSSLAYRIAYVAVYELIQKSGNDSVQKYLTAICSGKKPRDEFQTYFGMTYEKYNEYLVAVSEKKT